MRRGEKEEDGVCGGGGVDGMVVAWSRTTSALSIHRYCRDDG